MSASGQQCHQPSRKLVDLQPKGPVRRFRRKLNKFINHYAGW